MQSVPRSAERCCVYQQDWASGPRSLPWQRRLLFIFNKDLHNPSTLLFFSIIAHSVKNHIIYLNFSFQIEMMPSSWQRRFITLAIRAFDLCHPSIHCPTVRPHGGISLHVAAAPPSLPAPSRLHPLRNVSAVRRTKSRHDSDLQRVGGGGVSGGGALPDVASCCRPPRRRHRHRRRGLGRSNYSPLSIPSL